MLRSAKVGLQALCQMGSAVVAAVSLQNQQLSSALENGVNGV
jgi:hypothetical protein